MINPIGSSANSALTEQQQIAKSNDLDWDRYVREINELQANPPKQYAVTISYFSWYLGHELPAWEIPDLLATGVSAKDIGPTYNKRVLVSEPYMKILQANVPGYLQDIQEIDPRTGKPLDSGDGGDHQPEPGAHSDHPVATASAFTRTTSAQQTTATTRAAQPQPLSSSRAAHKSSSTTSSTQQREQPRSLKDRAPFDFTKLSPELQRTTLQLAEQLLTAALQRLSQSKQFADFSSLLDRTA
jgi:hypothetical protein